MFACSSNAAVSSFEVTSEPEFQSDHKINSLRCHSFLCGASIRDRFRFCVYAQKSIKQRVGKPNVKARLTLRGRGGRGMRGVRGTRNMGPTMRGASRGTLPRPPAPRGNYPPPTCQDTLLPVLLHQHSICVSVTV